MDRRAEPSLVAQMSPLVARQRGKAGHVSHSYKPHRQPVQHSGRMTDDVTAKTTLFLAHADRFTEAVGTVTDWSAQSPCSDWTAAQVVDHVVDTERGMVAERGADVGVRPTGEPTDVWTAHHDLIHRLLADPGFAGQAYDGYFGPTTVIDTLVDFYGFDLLVHGWDVARASGVPLAWTEREMDRIEASIEIFGDSLTMEGICKPAVPVPAEAPRQDRILGRLGRRP